MKKILLTLIISIIILGLTSILFASIQKPVNQKEDIEKTSPLTSPSSKPAKLPSSQDSFLTASLNSNFIPIRNWTIEEPDVDAKAVGVFDPTGEKFLFRKNIEERLPIASLTKIMTAIIALENLGLDEIITVSKKAVMTEGENGQLVIGEELFVRDLLYIMLIESSNDAAMTLAGAVEDFVALMNKKTIELGLENTHFVEPTGISKWNYSTIFDLARLVKYSFGKSLIWQILGVKEAEIYSQDRSTSHHLVNTNGLLGEVLEIIGGKTGFTEEAGGCMLTIVKKPDKPGEYLITVVLGSGNRELETKKLIEWAIKAYTW